MANCHVILEKFMKGVKGQSLCACILITSIAHHYLHSLDYLIMRAVMFMRGMFQTFQDQFEIHVHGGLLNLYTYYGSERTKDKNLLAKQDVVLTTYQTLSSEFSKV